MHRKNHLKGDPRGTLKRMLAKLDERGWVYNVGLSLSSCCSRAEKKAAFIRSRMMKAVILNSLRLKKRRLSATT